MHKHLNDLTTAEIKAHDRIYAFVPGEAKELVDTLREVHARRRPDGSYSCPQVMTVALSSRDEIPDLKARVAAAMGWEVDDDDD